MRDFVSIEVCLMIFVLIISNLSLFLGEKSCVLDIKHLIQHVVYGIFRLCIIVS